MPFPVDQTYGLGLPIRRYAYAYNFMLDATRRPIIGTHTRKCTRICVYIYIATSFLS